ncbi:MULTISPECIES: 2-amino-4-hydroxy-6-hydroxymethyldihydropteridine diphosphokinase [unclassified Shewanella]|jgi:2-amino-4-hydroxy-6-hydroxymethyldihydropteridine diphosphokinase|uniref:2-amino-4-hydroxy-6- hydroxymethyldihydropteridine diphosphokinase n=2 Tax=Gammaproteobacteria TaxID=1236 RepID=UPI00137BF28D|nr:MULTISPECIES: 2-amino-4-hydroxy-6-hydroxymethyldihydropteridine diphosphokinase [unclassified Shewanella]MBB1362569.1 2-amino-4-hydroxy-6-hydroxymethyldihydropteridine diphosphokinase [Shewanella sp. SR44-4]MBO1894428.1 2-amino-4-hydroxy-6-hydroxymethyldihydropteridine diphosphokinase [Shewanella sp. BF02_Schw]QHS14503.1 2-amino-4-hydroxy-6-hydroxymethyldihydropteridine diphosphokinase [Shewanella sp. Arc9-LZ]
MARIYISLGTNISPEKHLKAGLVDLQQYFGPLQLSRVFESESVGFKGTNFLNMVAAADTDLSIAQVVATFKQIEQDNGRIRGEKKFSPRSLDIDLLLYDDVICDIPVELPRGEILFNAFVLWPLAELVPNLSHPVTLQSYQTLWQNYDKQCQQLWPIVFEFPPELLPINTL